MVPIRKVSLDTGSSDLELQPTRAKDKQIHKRNILAYLIFTINSTPIPVLKNVFKLI